MTAEPIMPADADRDEWLAERQKGIGSSEIAAVLSLSPWESPFSLYWRKVGELPPMEDSDEMRWGRRLESAVADEYADLHPEHQVCLSGLYRSTVRPWQQATPDRELREVVGGELLSVLECKTDGSFDGWGEEGTDEVPVYYRCQVLWQMDVLDLEVGYLAVLFTGMRKYREYVIARDQGDLSLMREAGWRFWQQVQNHEPPDVDWHGATTRALKELHPELDEVEVLVPEDVAAEYEAAVAAQRAAKKRLDAAQNELRAHVGTGKWAYAGNRKIATRSVYDVAEHTVAAHTVDKLTAAATSKSKAKTIREAVEA